MERLNHYLSLAVEVMEKSAYPLDAVPHLDRLQFLNHERRAFLSLLVKILHCDDAPDAACEQLLVTADGRCADLHSLRSEVRKEGFIDIAPLVQLDRGFVDDLEAAALPDDGFDLFGLIRPNIVFGYRPRL